MQKPDHHIHTSGCGCGHQAGDVVAFNRRGILRGAAAVGTMPNSVYKGKVSSEDVQAQLSRFYYDTAQVSGVHTLKALAQTVPVSQIVYDTDDPYRTGADHTRGVVAAFSGAELAAIDRGNGLRIIPSLNG